MATVFPKSKLSEKVQRKYYDPSWEVIYSHFFNSLAIHTSSLFNMYKSMNTRRQ